MKEKEELEKEILKVRGENLNLRDQVKESQKNWFRQNSATNTNSGNEQRKGNEDGIEFYREKLEK